MKQLVPEVFSIALLSLGLSYLAAHRHWFRLFRDITQRPGLFLTSAMMMLVAGLIMVGSHNDWTEPFAIIVTVFGWGMAIEGLVILVNPDCVGWFRGISDKFLNLYLRGGGIILTALGATLVWRYLL